MNYETPNFELLSRKREDIVTTSSDEWKDDIYMDDLK